MSQTDFSPWSFYETRCAGLANGLEIFRNNWTTDLSPLGVKPFGKAQLLTDSRFDWFLARYGSLLNRNVLELGSLEGAHSILLERNGARNVLGLEANSIHYLKSLVIKEYLGLRHITFMLGDFIQYLHQTRDYYDLTFACGVLYHMTNPAELLQLAAERSDALFLWTVLYDSDALPEHMKPRLSGPVELQAGDLTYQGFRHVYAREAALELNKKVKFTGGMEQYSIWLELQELLRILKHWGYKKIIRPDNVTHNNRHGSNICLLCFK
ncbi:class I SAM-dependent methyltransferase [Desulfocurvibacter africanus]|uniref:class I SAM-dependent methyltransferase n=1 Tax=Desulfocurvibacter africanus TaxID=873 RepID=UPI002FD97B1F